MTTKDHTTNSRRTLTEIGDAHAAAIAFAQRLSGDLQSPVNVYLRATLDDWSTGPTGLFSLSALYFVKPYGAPPPTDAVLVWQTP